MVRHLFPLAIVFTNTAALGLPPWFHAALASFNSSAPFGWAYTVSSTCGSKTSVERFDPSLSPEAQWSLLKFAKKPPSDADTIRYRKYRATISSGSMLRATFVRDDINVPSMKLVRENGEQAEFRGRFRNELKDKLLDHLELTLTIHKKPVPFVEKAILHLITSFVPVISARIDELDVTMTFSAPTPELPALPLRVTSHFIGRAFWIKSIAEDIELTYCGFKRIQPLRQSKDRPATGAPSSKRQACLGREASISILATAT